MLKSKMLILALASLILFHIPASSLAYSSIGDAWVAHYNPCQTLVDADCNACHQNGFEYNSYGEDLRVRIVDLSMENVAAFVDAESEDSDGDNFTNGQEIVVDCTLPWDATSVGTVGDERSSWDNIKALYR